MKKFLFVFAAILFSSPAFAMHWMNCRSADGSVAFDEHEIWGANPLSCSYRGTAVGQGVLTLKDSTKVMIDENYTGPTPLDWVKTFAITAVLSSDAGPLPADGAPEVALMQVEEIILCKEENSSAMDAMEPPGADCEIRHVK